MLASRYEREVTTADNPILLIVASDPVLRAMFNRLFQAEYRLRFVPDAPAALAALRCEPVSVLVLDMTTPDYDGLDALNEIRASDYGGSPPVILISDLSDNHAAVQGLQGGANDYITKPLDENVVRARVETQIALKQAQDECNTSLTHLKFTQEMQENFTRIVSHDLKGPLTNIRMAQFMLRDIMRDNNEAASILDSMDTTLNSMIEMLHVFLDAMDSQRLEPKLTPQHIHDLVLQIIDQYSLAAERKQIRLTMHDCDRQGVADELLLRQVLSNLVSNAIKFSPPGTETSVWTEPHDDWVRICVADEGPGIPPEDRHKLFQMFSKLSVRPTGGESSTGLGLWIVKELTQLQHGRVGVDQRDGGGSVFWVDLPAAATAA